MALFPEVPRVGSPEIQGKYWVHTKPPHQQLGGGGCHQFQNDGGAGFEAQAEFLGFGGEAEGERELPPDILKRALMRLIQWHAAMDVEDLRLPPSNRLETLGGDRTGQWSIRINNQWRVCSRFEGGNAYDVDVVDYH